MALWPPAALWPGPAPARRPAAAAWPWRSRRRPSAPRRRLAASTKRNSASRMQADAHHAVAGLGTTTWRALAPSALATRSPWRGGVTGSAPPDSTSVAAGAAGKRVERRRHRALRPAGADRRYMAGEGVAEVGARPVGRTAPGAAGLRRRPPKVHALGHLHAAPARQRRARPQRLEAAARRLGHGQRQRRRQRRHVQRAAHQAQQRARASSVSARPARSPGAPRSPRAAALASRRLPVGAQPGRARAGRVGGAGVEQASSAAWLSVEKAAGSTMSGGATPSITARRTACGNWRM
jgi:hypothetical protein